MSLLGALTPLVKQRNQSRKWLAAVGAYTASGLIVSMVVGLCIGELGALTIPRTAARWLMITVLPLGAIICAAREAGWIHFSVPELKAQTRQEWHKQFGIVTASAMWGAHIGLGFGTRMTFMGLWVLSTIALVVGSPMWAVVLMGAYWFGRALSVWVAPLLVLSEKGHTGVLVMDQALQGRNMLRYLQIVTSCWAATIAYVMGRQL